MGSEFVAADLYCGASGLSCGIAEAGFDVKLGVDLDQWCAFPFTANCYGEFLHEDVQNLSPSTVRSFLKSGEVRLISACVPCQPYSEFNGRRARDKAQGDTAFAAVAKVVVTVKPEFVVMENVVGARRAVGFQRLLTELGRSGYAVSVSIVDAFDFGVAQRRQRLVLLASRMSSAAPVLKIPQRSKAYSVRSAIGRLPLIKAGETHPRDPLHRSARLSALNLRRLDTSVPGGTWRDWPSKLRLDCHRTGTGAGFSEAYGRMRWDAPAPTITTKFSNYGSGRFGHPEQRRALSLREGALLQGFPRKFRFAAREADLPMGIAARLIGNAVPPPLGRAIGETLIAHAEGREDFDTEAA